MLNILIIMTGEGVSNYEFKKALLHMCEPPRVSWRVFYL